MIASEIIQDWSTRFFTNLPIDCVKWIGIQFNSTLNDEQQSQISVAKLKEQRKKQLLNLDYKSPFRIGLYVFISMPSAPSGPWSGIAGVQKLIGAKAMRELEKEETLRIIECVQKFLSPKGIAVSFQKNAWNGLKSKGDVSYNINDAKNGKLKGILKETTNIPLVGFLQLVCPGHVLKYCASY